MLNDENAVNNLNACIDKNSAEITKAYESFFRRWQQLPTDDELKTAVIEGLGNLNKLYRAECTRFIEETIMPLLKSAIKNSLAPTERKYSIDLDFDEPYIKKCFVDLQKRFINSLVNSQARALKAVKAKCLEQGMKTSEIVRVFRFVLGLNSRNALENLKFQQTVIKVWYPPNYPFTDTNRKTPSKTPPNDVDDTSTDKVIHSLEQFYRQASSTAETAVALTYQMTNHELARLILNTAIVQGFAKIWRTAADERVCKTCGGLDGEIFAFDQRCFYSSYFTGIVPPAHLNCRCTVEYRQIFKRVRHSSFAICIGRKHAN